MMERSNNYKTLFDPSTGFWRGKIDDVIWIHDFDPYYPYYQYMYREANAWNALFFAPHDPEGMIKPVSYTHLGHCDLWFFTYC